MSQRVVMHFPNLKEDIASGITTLVLEDFISLIDVFSDVFRRGTANHRHEIIINLCVSHFGYFFRISRIIDFRILNYSDYYLLWLF